MSLFGAVRLYEVSADRIERDHAASDGDSVPQFRVGTWALWAQADDSRGDMRSLPRVSRVEPGPVHLAHGRSDPA
jgi:hypothetical protein